MQHPGPPRFLAVGESVQLAPRDPDPDATYNWWIRSAPVASTLELPERTPVLEFEPDAAGTYELRLDAPDGTHSLTVRAFGDVRASDRGRGVSAGSGGVGRGSQQGSPEPSDDAPGSGSGRGRATGPVVDRPLLQLHGALEGEYLVVRADPTFPSDGPSAGEVEFLIDDRDDVDPDAVTVRGRELRIPVAAVGDRVRIHGVAVAGAYSVPDTVEFTRVALPDGNVADAGVGTPASEAFEVRRPNDPPGWAGDLTFYEIYVRGFAGGDVDEGSVFEAIEDRLDYLADLGVDCLWLTPVLENDHAPHGYNIVDFFSIAEDLGEREDYEAFVDAAHDNGMAVLFDLVMNHSARDHPFFQDAYGDPDSEYYDWYDWQDNGDPETYFGWEYIANWNFENLSVRRHLLDAVDTWSEVADGFRCDMAWAVPGSFWQELRERVKARDPEFLLLDETIPYVPDFHNGMFDVHFDTTLYFTLRQVGRGDVPAEAILDAIDGRTEIGFPPHAEFLLYVENHDETRYVVECGDDAAFAAAGALFTLPGVPMIYGGQELGQRGRRDALAWDDAREEFYNHYERLVELRKSVPELRGDATLVRVDHERDTDRAVAYARESDAGTVVCALNFAGEPATLRIDRAVDPTDLVSGESLATAKGLEVDDVAVFRVE
ncbi:alpha-amylase MalA [Halobellus ruber]|uniref:Alpha-amylase n=1 Tax=Halobellus ruber TaxID=2761102 RepID=A0A7J9SI24_9EURY|nr:alpha-amylase MalA [Halobellus ruber]MBB6645627.1 alpha-amylase [Halobellus ruber]